MLSVRYGIEMQVPSGKLPGFYAQIIHQIGDRLTLFDRDQQLFIVTPADKEKLIAIFDKYKVTGEIFQLLVLPEQTVVHELADYGFQTAEHVYVYAERVAFFQISQQEGQPDDRWACEQQLQESFIVSLPEKNGMTLHGVAKNQADLVERTAAAYRVKVIWEQTTKAMGH
ncbi:hypothetical protein [Brevibacillus fulvus]|uniref:Uncharacterized protein n=1 Tax=Brevibacillus fulvus TaxID=1125967 RepID=A0A938XZJ2_9BACL|nr:hypothetical protein [Brevibacillus fulvus]MBM7589296.1 hypothetical protein [Brevibacillus fulvus]